MFSLVLMLGLVFVAVLVISALYGKKAGEAVVAEKNVLVTSVAPTTPVVSAVPAAPEFDAEELVEVCGDSIGELAAFGLPKAEVELLFDQLDLCREQSDYVALGRRCQTKMTELKDSKVNELKKLIDEKASKGASADSIAMATYLLSHASSKEDLEFVEINIKKIRTRKVTPAAKTA